MSNSISDFYLTPAVLIRTCIGLFLCSLSFTTQAVQPATNQIDLFAIQLTHSDTEQFSSYRLNTTVVNATTNNLVFGKKIHLPTFSDLKKSTFWTTSIRWHLTDNGQHAELSPRFRLESKESQIELNPLKRSVWMTWRRPL
jgi:hypothetical protein